MQLCEAARPTNMGAFLLALAFALFPLIQGQVPVPTGTQLVIAKPATLNGTTYWSGLEGGGGVLTIRVPSDTAGPLVTVTGSLIVRDAQLIDDNIMGNLQPSASFGKAIALPGLLTLRAGAKLSLERVVVSCSCADLLVLQETACRSLPSEQLEDMTVLPGMLVINSWSDAQTTVSSTTFSCPFNGTAQLQAVAAAGYPTNSTILKGSLNGMGAAPPDAPMTCAVAHVSTWEDLVAQTIRLQVFADNVTIVLSANLTVPYNYNNTANGSMGVYRGLRNTPEPSQMSFTSLNLGYIRGEGLWTMAYGYGSIVFNSLIFPTLPLGPITKFPTSLFPWAMWNVDLDRCLRSNKGVVGLNNCTLVVETSNMDYISHWAGEVLSPFPDRRAAAAWFGTDTSCNPPRNRTLLNQQVVLEDQYTWLAQNATVFGVVINQTIITDTSPEGIVTPLPGLQLTMLLDDHYAPFPTITWVENASALVQALATQATQNIVVLGNITIPPSLWPNPPITLNRDITIGGWPYRPTVLDWQGAAPILQLGKRQLKFRNLVLMNAPQCNRTWGCTTNSSNWAVNLTQFQWQMQYDRRSTQIVMENVTLVVPQTEFQVLQDYNATLYSEGVTPADDSALVAVMTSGSQGTNGIPASVSATASRSTALTWLLSGTTNGSTSQIPLLVDDGVIGYNVAITTQPPLYTEFQPIVRLSQNLVNPNLGSSPSRDGSAGGAQASPDDGSPSNSRTWRLVVGIVVPVSLVLLLGLVVGTFVLMRRVRRLRESETLGKSLPASSEQGSSQGGGTGGDSSDPEVGHHHHPRSSTEAVMPLIRAMEGPHGAGHLAAVHELRTASMHSLNSAGTASMQGSVSAAAAGLGSGHAHNGVDFLQALTPLVLHPYAAAVPMPGGAVVSADAGSGGALPHVNPEQSGVVRAATTGVLYPHYTLHPPPQYQSSSGVPPTHPWHVSQGGMGSSEPPGGPLSAFSSAKATPVWGSPAPPSQHTSSSPHLHHHSIPNSRTLYGQMSAAGSVQASPSSTQASSGELSGRHAGASPQVGPGSALPGGAGAVAGGGVLRQQRHQRAPSAGSSSRDGAMGGPSGSSRGGGIGGAGSSGTDRAHESSSSTPTQGLSGSGADAHRHSSFGMGGSAQRLRSVSGPPSSTQASGGDPRALHQHPQPYIGGAAPVPGSYGRVSLGQGSDGSAGMDSFDQVPNDQNQLLIHRMEMSRELQATISAPDVAAQLKGMVSRLQQELGDQELTITRVLGQGGSGVVYQGTWRGLTVAVKSLVFTVLPMQPMSRRQHRAMTEAAICRTLHHPNIVATYAYDLAALQQAPRAAAAAGGQGGSHGNSSQVSGSKSGESHHEQVVGFRVGQDPPNIESVSTATEFKLYIIQEFCDGGTLKTAIDDGRLHDVSGDGSPRPVMSCILQLAVDIAAGMAHVHSRNIVHGDLGPANVLLRINTERECRFIAKVADFGLSWKLASGQEHVSNARQGTGFYISPEVLHVGIMSKAADVFSFGMILHEMYHGTPVWRRNGTRMTAAAVALMQCGGQDQALPWAPDCPPEFKDLVSACLSRDPQARPTFSHIVATLLTMQQQLAMHRKSVETVPSEVLAGVIEGAAVVPRLLAAVPSVVPPPTAAAARVEPASAPLPSPSKMVPSPSLVAALAPAASEPAASLAAPAAEGIAAVSREAGRPSAGGAEASTVVAGSAAAAAAAGKAVLIEYLPTGTPAPGALGFASAVAAAGSGLGQALHDKSVSAVLPVVLEAEGEGQALASSPQPAALHASLSSNSAGLTRVQGGCTLPAATPKDQLSGECHDSGENLLPGLPPALVDSINESSGSGGEERTRLEPSSGQWPAAGAAMHGTTGIAQLTV